MKVKAALLNEIGADWEISHVELGDPVQGEVQVRLAASGLCHSDAHLASGATPVPFLPYFSRARGYWVRGRCRGSHPGALTASLTSSPPSTTSCSPVIQAASSPTRNTMALATSCGVPSRPSG